MTLEPELPTVERMQAVEVRPGDVIVATVPADTGQAEVERLRDFIVERWPGNRVAVLANGIELAVHRPTHDLFGRIPGMGVPRPDGAPTPPAPEVGARVTHTRYGPGTITDTGIHTSGAARWRVRWDAQAEVAPTHPGDWCALHELTVLPDESEPAGA